MRRQDEVGGGDIGGGDSPEGVDEHASATSGGGLASRTARGIDGEARGDAGAEASGHLRSAFVPRAEEEGNEVAGFRFGNVSVSIALSRGLPGGRFSRAFCKKYGDEVRFVTAVDSTA